MGGDSKWEWQLLVLVVVVVVAEVVVVALGLEVAVVRRHDQHRYNDNYCDLPLLQ